ncbi:MAG: hypothetical protein RLZZ111_77 [Planctomycetota bacterium]|jgi:hypothetical protein
MSHSRRPTHMLVPALGCLALLATGCGRRIDDKWTRLRPPVYPATGVVEYQGRPVAGATVMLLSGADDGTDPQAQMAHGRTDATGQFRLRRYKESEGAVAGEYRVTVKKVEFIDTTPAKPQPDRDYPPIEKSVLPEKYANFKTSGLTATVTAQGPNVFRFVLE